MSQVITKGYLIAREDYQTFDEIITFINEFGNKFVCLAQGTKKIQSHNARNMELGNFCEFQFFHARNENKVSKLMKIYALEKVEWPNFRQSLILLNCLANQLVYPNAKNYIFYKQMRDIALDKQISDTKAQLIILRNYCLITGIDLHVSDCVICHSHHIKTISFKYHGLICGQCFDKLNIKELNISFSKLIYLLFNNKYDQIDQYKEYFPTLLNYLKQYITENNGTFFPSSSSKINLLLKQK